MEQTKVAIRSSADVEALWRRLMGGGAFGLRTLWLVLLDEDSRTCGIVVPIDDLPQHPDAALLGNLAGILHDTGVPAALALVSRPGPRTMTEDDRTWARAIRRALGPELCPRPIHLATRDHVQVFAADDLITSA